MWEHDTSVDDDAQESPLKFILSELGITVTSQPANQVGVIGGNVSFGPVTVADSFGGLVQYQWQIQTDGATWEILTEQTGYYEGVATNTLAVKALDNYLANRATLNFRVAIFYPSTAPTFSNSASLTIPVHTNFTPSFTGGGSRQVGGLALINTEDPAVAIGFAGPYTYLWTQVSGAAFVIQDATVAAPMFEFVPISGWSVSIWQCTITSGINSITTDPCCFLAFGTGAPSLFNFLAQTSPPISVDGLSIAADPATFVPPWTVALQRNVRRSAAAPAVTIDSPSSGSTAFALNGPDLPGTMVSVLAGGLNVTGVGLFKSGTAGCSAWGL